MQCPQDQKKALNLLEPEVVSHTAWVLGTEFGSSGRVVHTVAFQTVPPVPYEAVIIFTPKFDKDNARKSNIYHEHKP